MKFRKICEVERDFIEENVDQPNTCILTGDTLQFMLLMF